MSGDIVAQDQIRAFVDRILRMKEGTSLADAIAMLRPKMDRLAYVINPLAEIGRSRTIASDRAVTAGARLLGIKNDALCHRVQMSMRKGSVENAVKSISEWMPGDIWSVPDFDPTWVGHVYVMAAVDYPGVFKVGFSRDLRQRQRSLESAHRINLRLVMARVATELDEHLVQHGLDSFRLANEWFDLTGRIERDRPFIRFYTPQRMWRELVEVA